MQIRQRFLRISEGLRDITKEDQYKGITADILIDQGNYVDLAISNIGSSLLLGGLFAMFILFVFYVV